MNSCGLNTNYLPSIYTPNDDNLLALKRQYIKALEGKKCTENDYLLNEVELFKLPVEKLQALSLSLKDIFTDKCLNNERGKIISYLLKVDSTEWNELLKQVRFIMPSDVDGHHVMWATNILSSVEDPGYRKKLTNVANRFFNYDTLAGERGYILNSLAKLKSEELDKIDNADEQTRVKFVAEHVPESLKEGAKTAFVYNSVQEKDWRV